MLHRFAACYLLEGLLLKQNVCLDNLYPELTMSSINRISDHDEVVFRLHQLTSVSYPRSHHFHSSTPLAHQLSPRHSDLFASTRADCADLSLTSGGSPGPLRSPERAP